MKEITKNFIVGKIYADLDELHLLTTYFQLVKINRRKKELTFKLVGGNGGYKPNSEGLYVFPFQEFYQLFKVEIVKLQKLNILKNIY